MLSLTIFKNCNNRLVSQNILHGCLRNWNKYRQEILIKKKMSYIKVKRQCFQDAFVHYDFLNMFLIRVVGAVGNTRIYNLNSVLQITRDIISSRM